MCIYIIILYIYILTFYIDILSGTCSDILSGIYSDILSGIHSDILSGILSGIFSFWHSGILFWHSLCSGPGPTHSVRSSRYEVRVQAQSEHEVRATAQPGARDMRFGDELAHQWTREKSRRRRGRRRRSCTFVKI